MELPSEPRRDILKIGGNGTGSKVQAVCTLLAQHDIDLLAADLNPITLACAVLGRNNEEKCLAIINILLAADPDLINDDNSLVSPLNVALYLKLSISIVKTLLAAPKLDPSSDTLEAATCYRDWDFNNWYLGITPIAAVAENLPRNEDLVMAYLDLLYKYDAHLFQTSYSAVLVLATENGFMRAAQWLVQHGVDVNAPDINSNTALFVACDVETIKYLAQHGADFNHQNAYGRTPLVSCCDNIAKLSSATAKSFADKITNAQLLTESVELAETLVNCMGLSSAIVPALENHDCDDKTASWLMAAVGNWQLLEKYVHNPKCPKINLAIKPKDDPRNFLQLLAAGKQTNLLKFLLESGKGIGTKEANLDTATIKFLQSVYKEISRSKMTADCSQARNADSTRVRRGAEELQAQGNGVGFGSGSSANAGAGAGAGAASDDGRPSKAARTSATDAATDARSVAVGTPSTAGVFAKPPAEAAPMDAPSSTSHKNS